MGMSIIFSIILLSEIKIKTFMEAESKADRKRSTISSIDRTELTSVRFPKEDVLTSDRDRQRRTIALKRAVALNGISKHPARLIINTKEGIRKVEAVILTSTKKHVTLKGMFNVPIRSIYAVHLL